MQIRTIRKGFEALECKFEQGSKHSKSNSNHSNANLNHLKGIRSVRMQIRTVRKGFEAFDCKFEQFEGDSNPSKVIQTLRMQI